MKVGIRTTSGQNIVSNNVTEVSVLWLNGSKVIDMNFDDFQKEFVLDKSGLRAITFKGNQTVFLDAKDIDYITSSNS
ncbi:hypothetical protein [Leuconostoc mesenteroides]|uniref:hypothetical protein n=1 Tax=Leuconostoc mesenteroides TaxID=1245 RepID=UPI00101EA027|nr:hypothetical protein [Leuconostoc mesenteroides]QBC40205.1 hypothetical protein EQK02_08085 [Leuconostoc mesenteroides]TGD33819.1 hypothetical protein EIA53_09450 [Leuconostoc mesenteroides]